MSTKNLEKIIQSEKLGKEIVEKIVNGISSGINYYINQHKKDPEYKFKKLIVIYRSDNHLADLIVNKLSKIYYFVDFKKEGEISSANDKFNSYKLNLCEDCLPYYIK
jgi:hypothetical protein